MFYAHSAPGHHKSRWHELKDHLTESALHASFVGNEFGGRRAAHLAALLHDLGKYNPAFQRRLSGAKEHVDHSTAGAQEVLAFADARLDRHVAQLISFGIAGHHTGLPNWNDDDSNSAQSSLTNRLKKPISIDAEWKSEITPDGKDLLPEGFTWEPSAAECAFQSGFLGRMIFSCLVDGDHRDTEAFFDKVHGRSSPREWANLGDLLPRLRTSFDSYLISLSPTTQATPATPLHQLRQSTLGHVRAQATMPKGFFTLTVPTGGGKTLASLGFALDHAQQHGLRRIIYVAPFTSIIDQTAKVFREVLGGEGVVLEHHSALDFETARDEVEFREKDDEAKLRLAMDDWAAPVIVTTSMQFFESLFANRPSKCRKLHAIANSVIIIDEAQTLPRPFLLPSLAALRELVKNYGVSIILCTATQPALDMADLTGGLPLTGRELAPNPSDLAAKLKRTTLKRAGALTDAQLVAGLQATEQGLIIVNTRRHALDLYRAAEAAKLDGLIHLTTRQYPAHRQRIMADIRQRLKDGLPCRVIATSLVEAGVDLDFPAVWRAEAGLDQIAQAAGRCNREGTRAAEVSFITVFTPAEHKTPREIKRLAENFETIANEFPEPFSPKAIRAFFKDVFWQTANDLDREKILKKFVINGSELDYSYKTVAERYRLIEDTQVPIIIVRDAEAQKALVDLMDPSKRAGPALRVLQRHIVQVYTRDRDLLLAAGKIETVHSERLGDRFWRIVEIDNYKDDVGLVWEAADELGSSESIY
jgi:CRISPR-associated endonuclease/helicase Cas3